MIRKQINGITVFDSGIEKEPLIFVHAFPLHSGMWDEQIKAFSDNYRIILYDVRGLGLSRQKNNQFMMEHYADDLIEIIDYLKLNKVNAIGLSMGGYIIQRALLKRRDLFRSVVLADTRLERDSNEGLSARSSAIGKILSGRRNEFVDGFLVNLVSKESYSNPGLTDRINSLIESNTDEGISGALLALATRPDNSDLFKEFDIPVLVLVGKDDVLTPLECSEKIRNSFKNAEMKIIENSGHLSNMENPAMFNKYLREFLEKIK